MGYRRFVDRDGNEWEVRDRTRSEWQFEPSGANRQVPRVITAPGYETDPFELSIEELQRLLDSQPPPTRRAKSPFVD